jgi:hypothetical protein
MRQRLERTLSAALVTMGMLLATSASHAVVITLVQENFNGVTLAGNQIRAVDEILTSSPGELTAGMLVLPSGSSPNVRRASNEINTNASPDGFGGVFNSKFLVLGDDRGPIGGNPSGAAEDTGIAIPFEIPVGAQSIRVSFDWAFDGIDIADNRRDIFGVAIFNPTSGAEILVRRSPGGFGSDTTFGRNFDVPLDLVPGDYLLAFILDESGNGDGRTNTAVGIDNIRVRAEVPLPATLLLLGIGIAGLAAARRLR